MNVSLDNWLEDLGYADEPQFLHRRGDVVSASHPYALEIHALLKDDGAIRACAVFDVEGVPTIVFLDGNQQDGVTQHALNEARKRIWNQNLATVIIHFQGDHAEAFPSQKLETVEHLRLEEVCRDGPSSASDVVSARLTDRKPSWFDQDARVDRKLLDNISATVDGLTAHGFHGISDETQRRQLAEFLMGEVLFVSYLEHRGIVGATYRERRGVRPLLELVDATDHLGVQTLIECLSSDFNGDFLADDSRNPWIALRDHGYELLYQFLRRTDMQTGQGEFWNYDFSYIPVELLSGLYEQFLSSKEQAAKHGAFYTPRHLAALAVDQAFRHSQDPLSETIFDGACGSGILLTTAFRRLLVLAEERTGETKTFAERCELLQRTIFGSDINPMACRVTAFSLYLSIFEGLDPSDILEAQEQNQARLPSLNGYNLAAGPEVGDFFCDTHAFAQRKFSVIISNPPWREPDGLEQTTADNWSTRANQPYPRRQIASAYALRALDFLDHGGLVSLILPISVLLGHTSTDFVSHLMRRYQPHRITNFGDLQELLFPTARHACHLFTAQRREGDPTATIDFHEVFDYCVPKADLTLALGHLTMQSADLHRLQTVSVSDNPQQLVSRMWGASNDIAIWTRLTARGTFADFASSKRQFHKRTLRKGIHLRDRGRVATSSEPLQHLPYLSPELMTSVSPVLHHDVLESWPQHEATVVGLNESVMSVFNGPRVIFPDGVSQIEPNVRAYYYDRPATFKHSIGVLASEDPADAPLLKFAAVYLRSALAQYFLVLRAWKMLTARGGVHLRDIKTLPFFEPSDAPDPSTAEAALHDVCRNMDEIDDLPLHQQSQLYAKLRPDLDRYIFSYFGISRDERALVKETTDVILPSIRPASLGSIYANPAQQTAGLRDYRTYARSLARSLASWRTKMKGQGHFSVVVNASSATRPAQSGVVRIDYSLSDTDAPRYHAQIDDEIVLRTFKLLHDAGLNRIQSGPSFSLVPDTHIWLNGSIYLIRPATKRSWSIRQALRDAEHIVRLVQS